MSKIKFEHFYMNSHLESFSSKCARLGISIHDELEKMLSWSPKQNSLFNEIVKATSAKLQFDGYTVPQENEFLTSKPIVGFSKLKKEINEIQNKLTENKSPQVSICSSCNYYNEWIPFDPNYKCYKCKNGL